jgi:nifR3 family TIM-barrel protein
MLIKPIAITPKVVAPNNVFLAPLAGYTNAVFREMCSDAGAGLTVTEMVSAKGLCYNSKATQELLLVTPTYRGIKACQLFGNDPAIMERAACSEEISPFDLIDINMGCPMPKIYNNGEGSALMKDLHRASAVIQAVKKSGKAVSVKFRVGLEEGHYIAREFAVMCQDSGADMICVHGRTRDKIYAGEVNVKEIANAKNAVNIPVIANGGVFSVEDADRLMNQTGADGVAIARGAMSCPWIFADFFKKEVDIPALIEWQLANTLKYFGEHFTVVYMRKMIAFYIKGKEDAAKTKVQLFACKTVNEIEDILKTISWE